jgi:hypothetical protein
MFVHFLPCQNGYLSTPTMPAAAMATVSAAPTLQQLLSSFTSASALLPSLATELKAQYAGEQCGGKTVITCMNNYH